MNVQGTAVFALQVHSHEVVPYDATPLHNLKSYLITGGGVIMMSKFVGVY